LIVEPRKWTEKTIACPQKPVHRGTIGSKPSFPSGKKIFGGKEGGERHIGPPFPPKEEKAKCEQIRAPLRKKGKREKDPRDRD